MKKIKIIVSIFFGVVFLASGFSYSVFAQDEKNWEGGKTKTENNSFIVLIDKMQGKIESAVKLIGESREYCNTGGCWKSINGGQTLEYDGKQGNWTIDNYGQMITCTDEKGHKWESTNSGQLLTYAGRLEKWNSDNSGQVLKYDDGRGNIWKSDNLGQILKYEGTQGKWEAPVVHLATAGWRGPARCMVDRCGLAQHPCPMSPLRTTVHRST